jgi:hypothetical protein
VLPLRVTRGEHCAPLLAERDRDQALYQLHSLHAIPLMANTLARDTCELQAADVLNWTGGGEAIQSCLAQAH